jgi:hypothetical protein
MSRRLVDFDPLSGIAHYSEWSELDDALRYTAVQDADNIVDFNRFLASEAPSRHGDGLTLAARIPMTLWTQLKQAGIIDDPARMKRWLADSNNRKWLVR